MPAADRLWREITNRLAREASTRVTSTFLRYVEGALSLEESVGIQATMIAAAQRRAVTANDLLLAMELTQRLEAEFTATGMQWMETPADQVARLSKAVTAVIGDDVAYVEAAAAGKTREQVLAMQARSIRQRLDRLTTGEVLDASQWSRQTAMQVWSERGAVAGWYRVLSPKACRFCRTLGGSPDPAAYIHPVTHRMGTHPGCSCTQGWVGEVGPGHTWVGPAKQMTEFA